MMPGPLRGLSLDEICLPKKHLYTKHGVYFSAMMMCMWDNIHGPKVLNVWTGDEPLPAPPPYEAKLAELSKEGEVVGASQIDPKKLTKEIKEQLATSELKKSVRHICKSNLSNLFSNPSNNGSKSNRQSLSSLFLSRRAQA